MVLPMTKQTDVERGFSEGLQRRAAQVDEMLDRSLKALPVSDDLLPVLEYTLSAPGKRIRPVLVLWCCELVGGQVDQSTQAAAVALEMIHTYSLVHDDLPAMDDDDLRRGRPTCHKVYDEATAILAGDALLTLAFELLGTQVTDAALALTLVRELAQAAGPEGMIAGQMADLKAERDGGDVDVLQYIHIRKTARLFQCACVLGALCGGGSKAQVDALGRYGQKIGLGFQIADDVLDVCATSQQLGKTAGKDEQAGKLTYPSLVGLDQAHHLAKQLAQEAVNALALFGSDAKTLIQLVYALMDRQR